MLQAVVLGCGTSHGVPMIGCACDVCTSSNPKNKRTRSAIVIRSDTAAVLIDAPPELRLQLVREHVATVDAVVFTHSHADHIMGLDDVRRINEITGHPMPIYAQPEVLEDLKRVFQYAFVPALQEGGGLPSFSLREFPDSLQIADITLELLPVLHGKLPVLAVRCNDFAYLTDVSEIPPEPEGRLQSLDTLILDATRYAPHPSHLHFEAALETAKRLNARQTYLTHLSHDYDYDAVTPSLPEGIALSYDGLIIDIV